MGISQELLGTIPGWITAGGIVGILGLVVRWQLGIKKIAVEAQQVEVNAQQASNADRADVRDHYAEEVRRLTELVTSIMADHEECKRERDQYRREVSDLDNKLRGITRQFVAFQLETAKAIPPEQMTPSIEEMLRKLQSVAEGKDFK